MPEVRHSRGTVAGGTICTSGRAIHAVSCVCFNGVQALLRGRGDSKPVQCTVYSEQCTPTPLNNICPHFTSDASLHCLPQLSWAEVTTCTWYRLYCWTSCTWYRLLVDFLCLVQTILVDFLYLVQTYGGLLVPSTDYSWTSCTWYRLQVDYLYLVQTTGGLPVPGTDYWWTSCTWYRLLVDFLYLVQTTGGLPVSGRDYTGGLPVPGTGGMNITSPGT